MSVIQNKLVPVDYDGNGTADLGFFQAFTIPNPLSSEPTIRGALGAWLLAPGSGTLLATAVIDGAFNYTTGDRNLLGDGFIPGFGFSYPAFPLEADFNGDGKTDQVFGSDIFEGTNIFEGATLIGFELATWFMDGLNVTGQQFIKLPDGVNDAVVPLEWADLNLYLNTATGKPAIGGQGPLADLNGDGTTDILLLKEDSGTGVLDVGVWLVQNGTAFVTKEIGSTPPDWSVFNTNDFDGNGTVDLLLSFANSDGSTTIGTWLLNSSGDVFSTEIVDVLPSGWSVLDTNDFDGNGTADILISTVNSDSSTTFGVWTLDNDANILDQRVLETVAAGWNLLDHNDFNGDGIADMLLKSENGTSDDQYAIWVLNGTGAFIDQRIVGAVPDGGYEFMNTGDYNGDGSADLAFVNQNTDEVALWLMSGAVPINQFVLASYGSTESNWNGPFLQPPVSFPAGIS